MAADSAPDSPHAALLAAPLLDDLLSLDLELASEDTASGGAGQGRSAAGSAVHMINRCVFDGLLLLEISQ